MTQVTEVTRSIDARGMPCPGPLMTSDRSDPGGSGRRRDRGPLDRCRLEDRHPGMGDEGGHELVAVTDDGRLDELRRAEDEVTRCRRGSWCSAVGSGEHLTANLLSRSSAGKRR